MKKLIKGFNNSWSVSFSSHRIMGDMSITIGRYYWNSIPTKWMVGFSWIAIYLLSTAQQMVCTGFLLQLQLLWVNNNIPLLDITANEKRIFKSRAVVLYDAWVRNEQLSIFHNLQDWKYSHEPNPPITYYDQHKMGKKCCVHNLSDVTFYENKESLCRQCNRNQGKEINYRSLQCVALSLRYTLSKCTHTHICIYIYIYNFITRVK